MKPAPQRPLIHFTRDAMTVSNPRQPRSIPKLLPLLCAALFAPHPPVFAQKLPPPTRTVFKCTVDGKTTYSDAPCEGAQRVDIQPTRGLNKSSGTERIGADVRAERQNEVMAEALRPLLGETAAQRTTRHKRAQLPPEQARRCYALDGDIAAAEARERTATGPELKSVQSALFKMRQAFFSGGC